MTLVFIFFFITTLDIPAAFLLLYWFRHSILQRSGFGGDTRKRPAAMWPGSRGGFVVANGTGYADVAQAASLPAVVLMFQQVNLASWYRETAEAILAIAAHPDDETNCGGTLIHG